jgi:Tfp pilus assembly protein PilX
MCYLFGDKEKRERGAVLVSALLILAVLSLAGIASLNTTTVEIEATGNVKRNKMGFYAANGGVEMTPRLIRTALTEMNNPAATPFVTYDANFYGELMGYVEEYDDNDLATAFLDSTTTNPDIQMTIGQCTAAVDVFRLDFGGGHKKQPGVVFGRAGGSSGGAGVYIQYNFTVLGTAPGGDSTVIGVEYLYRVP